MRIVLFVSALLAATSGIAEDNPLTNLAIIPMAYRPVEIQDSSGRLLEQPAVHEYVRLSRYDYSEGSRPSTMDVVAIIENVSEGQADAATVVLESSRRVTLLAEGANPQPTGEWSVWQAVDRKELGLLSAHQYEKVVFEEISVADLWLDLWQAGRWPSEIRFRVALSCGGCATKPGKEATIRFVAGD